MATLLFIQASPRKERSISSGAANSFIDAYAVTNPQDVIETINLWDLDIPEVDEALLVAKYAIQHGLSHTRQQAAIWDKVVKLTKMFTAADSYVISIPMWNFSIPYKLKHFIDVITQSRLTFNYSEEHGFRGMVTDKPVTLIYVTGSGYPNSKEALHMQKQQMEMWLRFIGLTDISAHEIQPIGGNANFNVEATCDSANLAPLF